MHVLNSLSKKNVPKSKKKYTNILHIYNKNCSLLASCQTLYNSLGKSLLLLHKIQNSMTLEAAHINKLRVTI